MSDFDLAGHLRVVAEELTARPRAVDEGRFAPTPLDEKLAASPDAADRGAGNIVENPESDRFVVFPVEKEEPLCR